MRCLPRPIRQLAQTPGRTEDRVLLVGHSDCMFLLERGLRFRHLGVCGHDLICHDDDGLGQRPAVVCTCTDLAGT